MRPGILLRFCRKYGIMKGKNIRRGGVGTVNEGLQEYAHRLRVMGQLSSAEYAELIRFRDGELLQLLCSYTEQIRCRPVPGLCTARSVLPGCCCFCSRSASLRWH